MTGTVSRSNKTVDGAAEKTNPRHSMKQSNILFRKVIVYCVLVSFGAPGMKAHWVSPEKRCCDCRKTQQPLPGCGVRWISVDLLWIQVVAWSLVVGERTLLGFKRLSGAFCLVRFCVNPRLWLCVLPLTPFSSPGVSDCFVLSPKAS